MSTAYYPLGMRSMSASGYNQHSSQPQGYVSWKGSGVFSNPVGVTASHIRPLTNNDPGNVFQTGFGLPRPMKHYRKGRVIPAEPIQANDLFAKDPYNQNIEIIINQTGLINYNMNRIVKSSKGSSLGGGSGGRGLLNQMIDTPGSFLVKQNTLGETNNGLDKECKTCEGVGIVASYYPNTTYLTDNPENVTQTPKFCCNEERKARRRVVYANTNLKKNYYTTHKQYLQNRCQTYEQKAFNFMAPNPVNIAQVNNNNNVTPKEIANAKPGSPLALYNTYFANCFPNGEIYDATEDALILKLLNIMETKGILTPEQVQQFEELNKFNLDELFLYIQGLKNPEAINEFLSFINNPYIGMPLSGPSNRLGCKLTVYKPSNPQFAVQGAVDSSTRMLKLNVDTISTNAASFGKKHSDATANEISQGANTTIPFILKNKATPCNIPPVYPFQNHKSCSNLGKKFNTPNTPVLNGSNIHFIRLQPPFSSNHFSQSPNTYNTTHA